jgi:hypothetical protein
VSELNRRHICHVLAWIAALALGVAILDVLTGGINSHLGSVRLSSHDAHRPFVVFVIMGSAAIWISDRRHEPTSNWERIARSARPLAVLVAIITVAAGIRFGIFAAGGADAYGYVSEAALWAHGTLTVAEPLAHVRPSLGTSVAPLGYRLAAAPGDIVPIYPPGLPLMMALASRVAGPTAVYYIVPLLGGLCVWLTFSLGGRIAGPRTGLGAAVLVACSPIFLLQLIEPLSDVPATAFWLISLSLALINGPLTALLAGFAASCALLTRPNLLPLASVVAVATLIPERRLGRPLSFVAGLLPGCAAVAAFNWFLYGSPLASGYGPADTLFSWRSFPANLRRYPLWLLELHSIFIFFSLLAPFARGGSPKAQTSDSGTTNARISWLLLAFCAVLSLCYLFYIPYDTWPFLRFLLPGVPILLVLSSAVTISVVNRLSKRYRAATTVALFGLLAGWCLKNAANRGIFQTAASESRYVAVGQFIDRELPPNAVILSVIESGSVRLYGHRSSVRWDQLRGEGLDASLRALQASGYDPYLLLEDWEEAEFRARFASASGVGALDWPPAAEYRGYQRVRIYLPNDRARVGVRTKQIPGLQTR